MNGGRADWDCLKFNRDDLIERELLDKRYRSPKHFENDFLTKNFNGSLITVYQVLDSKSQAKAFKLSKKFQRLLKVVNAITSPEIEMMFIISEGHYDDFSKKYKAGKNKMKPSEYVKRVLKIKDIKRYEFVYNYFNDKTKLLKALKDYSKGKNHTIYDLVKNECKKLIA